MHFYSLSPFSLPNCFVVNPLPLKILCYHTTASWEHLVKMWLRRRTSSVTTPRSTHCKPSCNGGTSRRRAPTTSAPSRAPRKTLLSSTSARPSSSPATRRSLRRESSQVHLLSLASSLLLIDKPVRTLVNTRTPPHTRKPLVQNGVQLALLDWSLPSASTHTRAPTRLSPSSLPSKHRHSQERKDSARSLCASRRSPPAQRSCS